MRGYKCKRYTETADGLTSDLTQMLGFDDVIFGMARLVIIVDALRLLLVRLLMI